MSRVKKEVTKRYGIVDKAAAGFGGGVVKIRYFKNSSEIDVEVSKLALILDFHEAVMVARALLEAAMPSEDDFESGGES